jgi:hypothetical protein
MRWRAGLVAIAAGCGFSPSATPNDARRDAAPAPPQIDASFAPDAVPACTIATNGALVAGGTIGGDGGDVETTLACAASEVAIGIQLDMSTSTIDNHGGEVVAVSTHLRCGTIARDGSGAMVTTPAELLTQLGGQGGGNCSSYFPTATTAEADCPSGSVIVALDGNLPEDTLFNSLSITCAALSGSTITPTTVKLAVDTTGDDDNSQHAPCPAGTALVQLGLHGACGQDELLPQCAPLACN